MTQRRTTIWGWGFEDEQPTPEQKKNIAKGIAESVGASDFSLDPEPRVEDIQLRTPRLSPPEALANICSTETYDRAAHAYGKALPDIVRAFRLDFPNPPDVVAFPKTEDDVVAVLDWCNEVGAAAIPFGGGSSVTSGVEPPTGDAYPGSVSIDLRYLDKVLEIDESSRAARIQAGVYGPALEAQLKPHGYTLRHYPQSFEFSTLGGWIATRSGRAFCHAVHPYRRVGRVHPSRYPERDCRFAPSARVGRRSKPGPHVYRLGGDSGYHYRSLDALAASSCVSGLNCGTL